jgi:O-antigen ligase
VTDSETANPGRSTLHLSVPVVLSAALFWGVFLLKLKLPVMLGIAAAGLLVTCYGFYKLSADRVALLVLANYALWLGTGFLVGAVTPGDLIMPRFFGGEGRIFLYYLPLLFFSVHNAMRRDLTTALSILKGLALASFLLMCVWVVAPAGLSTSHFFTGLISTHTAAGTFFGTIAVALLVYGLHRRSKPPLLWAGLALLPMLASGSREALLSLATVAAWYVLLTRRIRLALALLGAGALGIALLPVVAPSTYARSKILLSPATWVQMNTLIQRTQQPLGFEKSEGGSEGEVNALNRILFWMYAAAQFEKSPLVGIGYGRLNDIGVQLEPVAGIGNLGMSGTNVSNTANAHNSYLQILAENGVLGLALLLALWFACYRRLGRFARRVSDDPEIQALCVAGQGTIIFTLASAMVGHALGAPAIGLPVLSLTGMVLGYERWMERAALVPMPQAQVMMVGGEI